MGIRKYTAFFIVALTLLVTYLNYSTGSPVRTLHNIYRELYYIPVLLGALTYGLAGALLAYSLVFALYLPYVIMTWPGPVLSETNRLLPLLLQGLFALIAGYLVDRERRQRKQLDEERSLADIGRTAAAVVHDLKSPLIAVLGFAERIREGRGKIDAEAQVIINAAEHMQKIATSVLNFARPVELELADADVRDIVRRAGDSCRMTADWKEVRLSVDLPAAPVTGRIDGQHLERALANLIVNAVEASGKGQTVSVGMGLRRRAVAIIITDRGSGMDRETLEHVFIPFYSKKRGGTGLGMPIARKVIEGHRGSIRIRSRAGEGTEVTVELPVSQRQRARGRFPSGVS